MYNDEAMQETAKDILIDALPPELKKVFKTHEKHRRRIESEKRQMQTQAQFLAYQKETETTLNALLKHSKEEKEKREAAEKKARFWMGISIALGVLSIVLALLQILKGALK